MAIARKYKLEYSYNNKTFSKLVKNEDEAYLIISNLLGDPNISEAELDDLYVLYDGKDDVIIMVE